MLQPLCDSPDVVTGGGEDGVDAAAFTSLEMVPVQSMFLFEAADNGLDGGSPIQSVNSSMTAFSMWPS